MKFKSNKPTHEQSRSGTYFEWFEEFCWLPRQLSNDNWVWLEKVKVKKWASWDMFGNHPKWMVKSVKVLE